MHCRVRSATGGYARRSALNANLSGTVILTTYQSQQEPSWPGGGCPWRLLPRGGQGSIEGIDASRKLKSHTVPTRIITY
eukprot:5818469-Amphidinium_carterae.1